jgi:hypothetical protein
MGTPVFESYGSSVLPPKKHDPVFQKPPAQRLSGNFFGHRRDPPAIKGVVSVSLCWRGRSLRGDSRGIGHHHSATPDKSNTV